MIQLNAAAAALCRQAIDDADRLRIAHRAAECGTTLLDFGIESAGGLAAGRAMAEICMSGLGQVSLAAGSPDVYPGPAVMISTDHPLAACMASQYAGWQITSNGFFAMASGPMRAAAGKEELFQSIGHRETPPMAVGVLESGKFPPDEVCQSIAADCGIAPADLTLAVAPTASIAGTVQVVARTVETALHKMHELGFDIAQVESGLGVAPLPPVAAADLEGIGRTNDAVLYGGQVTLWLQADDEQLKAIGPQIPSSASSDYGRPFAEIFAGYGHDFYKIDPLLFSPAEVTLVSLKTGSAQRYGETRSEILQQSFGA